MELLSERLRKASEEIEGWRDSDDAISTFDEYFSVPEGGESWGKDLAIGLNTIADEIERRYIPRPCFEDGEPVQFGDEIRHPSTGKSYIVKSIHVFDDGFYCFSHKGSHTSSCYTNDELVERPSKVLDADGAEIKVGDEGWDTKTGQPYEVLGISDGSLKVTDRVTAPKWIEAKYFTHREPDSLEKLRDDINDYLTIASEGAGIKNTSPLDGWADRLTALIERNTDEM